MVNTHHSNSTKADSGNPWKKVLGSLALCIIGLLLVNALTYKTAHWFTSEAFNHFMRGFVFSFIIVFGIWLIDKYAPGSRAKVGYRSPLIAFKTFALGIGLILVPLTITLIGTVSFGWAKISINETPGFVPLFIVGLAATLLTDALPEEVIFRGVIYANLNKRYSKLKSSLISVGLFVLFPVVFVQLQKLLGLPVIIGGADHITPSFMVTMLFFGSFMQYLRVLTKSVWTSIGFHTLFVYMNQLMGTQPQNLIQMSDFSNEKPMQILLITLVVLTFIGLLVYPRLAKKRIDWKS